MDKNEIFELVIREMTETALLYLFTSVSCHP